VLTHYTGSSEAVANILTHGFAWIPNRRKLAKLLIPQHDFSRREPQQFGMISFTELELSQARVHRDRFGAFGIVIAEQWARERGAQRVIYLDEEGPITVALRMLFEIGYRDVTGRIEYPDDALWLMAYENKNSAGAIAGSSLWAHLLQLWEYLEPASSAAQRELRIVNPDPLYSLSDNKSEAIAHVSPPQNWAKYTHVLPVPRSQVVALICRRTDLEQLQFQLPLGYEGISIIETDD
jgi:hypothetical protein